MIWKSPSNPPRHNWQSEFEVWFPQDAGGAVATLHRLLKEHRQEPMSNSQRFPYSASKNTLGGHFPPVACCEDDLPQAVCSCLGLVDSGADGTCCLTVTGIALRILWSDQLYVIRLSGNLANFEARAVVLSTQVGDLPPVDLAFAWTQAEQPPLIFGHTNFFEVFDICFFRTDAYFSITQKGRI
jgi:hypothetical protein